MKKIAKYIYLIIYILIIILLFFFSLRDGKESTTDSNQITNILLSILKIFNLEDSVSVTTLSHIVRKLIGHFGLFFICGFFGINTFINFIKNKKYSIIINLSVGLLIATTSELLQLIPVGRSCRITDVLIDYSGYLLVCIFYIFIKRKSLVTN